MGKIADVWNGAAFLIKAAIILAVLLVALIFLNRLKPAPDEYKVPEPDGYEDYHEATPTKPIPESKVPALPNTKPGHVRGKVTVTTRDTVHTVSGKDTVIQHTVDIFIPTNDQPPIVDGGPGTHVVYAEVSEPWFVIRPGIFVGGTVNMKLEPSLYGGLLIIQGWKVVDLGVGIDRNGLGPMGGYEFWREFTIFGQYNVITFTPDKQQASIGIAYRF